MRVWEPSRGLAAAPVALRPVPPAPGEEKDDTEKPKRTGGHPQARVPEKGPGTCTDVHGSCSSRTQSGRPSAPGAPQPAKEHLDAHAWLGLQDLHAASQVAYCASIHMTFLSYDISQMKAWYAEDTQDFQRFGVGWL